MRSFRDDLYLETYKSQTGDSLSLFLMDDVSSFCQLGIKSFLFVLEVHFMCERIEDHTNKGVWSFAVAY